MPAGWEEDLAESNFQVRMICKKVKSGLTILTLEESNEETNSLNIRAKLEPVPEEEEGEYRNGGEDTKSGEIAEGNGHGVNRGLSTSSANWKEIPARCEEVVLSHVESKSEVWVQKVGREYELDQLLEELQILQPNLETVESPQVGDLVAATFSEDGEVYRAKVAFTGTSRSNVFFVDFGNGEEKDNEKLLQLPFHLQDHKLPAFAEKVTVAKSGVDWSKEQLVSLKGEVVALNSRGEVDLNKVDANHGNLNADENNNMPPEAVVEMDLAPCDLIQAADDSEGNVEEIHTPPSSPSAVAESISDSSKFHQVFNSSISEMKRAPSSAIIDASDDEDCGCDDNIEDVCFATEQVANVEILEQPLDRSCFDLKIEVLTPSPQSSLEDEPGDLGDLTQDDAVEMIDKLMAGESREEKRGIISKLDCAHLPQLAICPTSSQVVQAAMLAVSQDRDLQPLLVQKLAALLPTLATHPVGYLTIVAALDAATSDERLHFTRWLEEEDVVLNLLGSRVGAFIMRRMLEWGVDPSMKKKLTWILLPHVQDLAAVKTATWVLKRLLKEEVDLGTGEREYASELISSPSLDKLVGDPVGEYESVYCVSPLHTVNGNDSLHSHVGCDILASVVSLREGSLAPRAASWILRNTSIDSPYAAQFASVVRQLLEPVAGRENDPSSQFMLGR